MRKHFIYFAAVIFLAVMGMTGCGNKSNSQDLQVRIGYFNNITHAQALLMKEDGSLEEALGEDIGVKWKAFNAGPAEVEAFFADELDIGYIGPVPAITANVKSEGDVQVLAGVAKGGSVLVVREGSGVASVEDLSGKTVAIPQIGNTQHLCLLSLLKENGLKPVTSGGDVVVSAVVNADVANIMGRGDIDAALVPEPWGTTLLRSGAQLILDYNEIYLNGMYDVAVVVVRKDFLEKHSDIVEIFLEQHHRATESINTNSDEVLQRINKELLDETGKSLSDDVIKEAFERIVVSTEVNEESMERFAEISFDEGIIRKTPGKEQLYAAGAE